MIIAGGAYNANNRQLSLIESCRLERIGDLPIEFSNGACNTFRIPSVSPNDVYEHAILCFSSANKNGCFR